MSRPEEQKKCAHDNQTSIQDTRRVFTNKNIIAMQ